MQLDWTWGSGSMEDTVTRYNTVGFIFLWSNLKDGVYRVVGTTQKSLLARLHAPLLRWIPRCCDVCPYLFYGALKPTSICTADTLNNCFFEFLQILLLGIQYGRDFQTVGCAPPKVVSNSVYATLGSEVYEQMFRSSGQSDVKPPVLGSQTSLVLLLSTHCRDERLSQPCPAWGLNL
ncbi:hypothetical protein TNCV_491991 [Trichonephila clavipes]|nr:hypothetical protein TNCV_491991 [Trichonephila clavipes]